MYIPSNNFDFPSTHYIPSNNFDFTDTPKGVFNFTLDNVTTTFNVDFIPTISSTNLNYTLNNLNNNLNADVANLSSIDFNLDNVISNINSFIIDINICNLNYKLDDISPSNTSLHSTNITDYIYCANEGDAVVFTRLVDVAYGANGSFAFLYNRIGQVLFSNVTFGDPAVFYPKTGYYRYATPDFECVIANDYNVQLTLDDLTTTFNAESLPLPKASIAFVLDDISYNLIDDISSDTTFNFVLDSVYNNINCVIVESTNCDVNFTLDNVITDINAIIANDAHLNYILDDISSNIVCSDSTATQCNLNYQLDNLISNTHVDVSHDSNLNFDLDNTTTNIQCKILEPVLVNFDYTLDSVITNINAESTNLDLSFIGYTGNDTSCLISTSSNLEFECYTGDTLNSFDIIVPPPVDLGTFDGYTDNFVYISLYTQNHPILSFSAYTGNSGIWQQKSDIIVYDLDIDSCCYSTNHRPHYGDNWNIELGFADAYDENFNNKTKTIFSVELSTRSRLHFIGYTGNSLVVNSGIDILTYEKYNAYSGNYCSFEFLDNDYIKLCKGNFIPDSENVNIELADTLLEDCGGLYVAYTGNHCTFTLECIYNLQPSSVINTGNYGIIMLETFPYIPPTIPVYNAYGGEFVSFNIATQMSLSFTAYQGMTGVMLDFKEPKYNGYMGMSCTIAQLQEKIGVAIYDSGDLLNEYIYIDENGNPIPELFTQEVVELYPYQHYIKASCVR